MPRCARLLFLALLISTCGSQLLLAQESCVTDKANPCNGISVGKPKVFDNRTLTLMIDNLSTTLQSMQTGFIDQKSVAAALANIQGFQSHDVTSNFQVNTLPLPGITNAVTKTTGNVDANGNPLPDTTQTQTTTTQNAFTPTPPALGAVPTLSGFNPTYGENAADLLTDQVNLSYQIFNLRMILERALSDRLLHEHDGDNSTRLQAVLGFNVGIDPPRTANDAVAVVEITLCNLSGKGGLSRTKGEERDRKKDNSERDSNVCQAEDTATNDGGVGLSLVALMPQEKTYNAASLSTKSNAFGGTAVVKTIQVGYSQRRSGQTFYLYRDNDTISYERMDPDHPNTLIFGWMFRPVLGRRSVSPGMRQLFAVASLPDTDCTDYDKPKGNNVAPAVCKADLFAHVKTYWKKYDGGTLTAFEGRDANLATRVKYFTTATLTRPEIFDKRYLNVADYSNIRVESSSKYQDELRPVIHDISWVPVGSKTALISAVGNNFFTGTKVSLGDKTYVAGDGLTLKSNQAFDLLVPLDSLTKGTAAVIGPYGSDVPLVPADESQRAGKIEIQQIVIGPKGSGVRTFQIKLQVQRPVTGGKVDSPLLLLPKLLDKGPSRVLLESKDAKSNLNDLVATPIIMVNDNVVPLPYKFVGDRTNPCDIVPLTPDGKQDTSDKNLICTRGIVEIDGYLPESFLSGCSGLAKVSYPFLTDSWTAYYDFVADASCNFQLSRLSDTSLLVQSPGALGFKLIDPTTLKGPDEPSSAEPTPNKPAPKAWTFIAACDRIEFGEKQCKPTSTSAACTRLSDNAYIFDVKKCSPATPDQPPGGKTPPQKAKPAATKKDAKPAAADDSAKLPDKIVLVSPIGAASTLDVPKATADASKDAPIMLHQYDSVWKPITGDDLTSVDSVQVNQKKLNFRKPDLTKLKPGEKVTSVMVEISRDITAKPGNVDVAVLDKNGKALTTAHLQIVCTDCKNSDGGK